MIGLNSYNHVIRRKNNGSSIEKYVSQGYVRMRNANIEKFYDKLHVDVHRLTLPIPIRVLLI